VLRLIPNNTFCLFKLLRSFWLEVISLFFGLESEEDEESESVTRSISSSSKNCLVWFHTITGIWTWASTSGLKGKIAGAWLGVLNDPMTSNIQTPNRIYIYISTTASRCISTSTSLPSLKFEKIPGRTRGLGPTRL
jgi:hypothetical protein